MQICSTASPNGHHVAFVRNSLICRQSTRRRTPAVTGGRKTFEERDINSIKWAPNACQVLVTSNKGVKVLDTDDFEDLAILANGSGGLGKIASADFVGNDRLLVIWEFGKAKLWHLRTGRAWDLPDVKTTCDGRVWQSRPGKMRPALLALLRRNGAEDQLVLQFPTLDQTPSEIKLATTDAQSISWSPDGRWLAIRDTPSATPNLHIHTPDGHLFRSWPSKMNVDVELGVKSTEWSPDGRVLALACHDGRVELLNARTFSQLATIEHHTTIDQSSLPVSEQAPVWQERVSSTNERSYSFAPQPVCPPLSRTKPISEPEELGVAELCFSCDGSYLATRDCRMLNTIWIWDMATLAAHSVLLQHSNVRKLTWHPTRAETLLVDCAEGIAHIFDVTSSEPPMAHHTGAAATARLAWILTASNDRPIIMLTQKTQFRLLYPEGQDEDQGTPQLREQSGVAAFEEGASEDSLFEVLSGRKPLPPKTAPSYTEMIDMDVEGEDTIEAGLDDTFREKRKPLAKELDPLDDSEIF
ncbi:hypothetical protein AC579_1481 [Pseudocercospora musae]|uniref:Anaphase-promoting complex subunit 4-like WD40 domain-containing protein n=1 Tax=Pseudocercospora musae TaxID=113226 RepID=A0A139I2A1_9PEZI|nr:hypothetical protein AC579_1481 [Pseudocercospora musae]